MPFAGLAPSKIKFKKKIEGLTQAPMVAHG